MSEWMDCMYPASFTGGPHAGTPVTATLKGHESNNTERIWGKGGWGQLTWMRVFTKSKGRLQALAKKPAMSAPPSTTAWLFFSKPAASSASFACAQPKPVRSEVDCQFWLYAQSWKACSQRLLHGAPEQAPLKPTAPGAGM